MLSRNCCCYCTFNIVNRYRIFALWIWYPLRLLLRLYFSAFVSGIDSISITVHWCIVSCITVSFGCYFVLNIASFEYCFVWLLLLLIIPVLYLIIALFDSFAAWLLHCFVWCWFVWLLLLLIIALLRLRLLLRLIALLLYYCVASFNVSSFDYCFVWLLRCFLWILLLFIIV